MSSSAVVKKTFSPVPGVSHDIKILMLSGAPWFVATDVCRALGLSLSGGAHPHLKKLANDERRVEQGTQFLSRSDHGCPPKITIISESGLYKLTMRSDLASARPFQDWVTRDVLPTIRKTGSYVMGEEKLKI